MLYCVIIGTTQEAYLPTLLRFFKETVPGKLCIVVCDTGFEVSAPLCIAVLLANDGKPGPLSKEQVRLQLAVLQRSHPYAHTSRELMKELNNYFVSRTGGWEKFSRVVL